MTVTDSHGEHAEQPSQGGAGSSHDHPPHLAHHWETSQQQFEAGKLGMWLFLATELLLFGGLFAAYAVFRYNHPAMFSWGSQFLDVRYGGVDYHLVHDPQDALPGRKFVICGHVHNLWKYRADPVATVNVGVDVWDFRPVRFCDVALVMSQKSIGSPL